MNKFLLALFGLSISMSPLSMADENFYIPDKEHSELIRTLESVGVDVLVNVDPCAENIDGRYAWVPYSGEAFLFICQTNSHTNDGLYVKWVENDYDTLRHEAAHVIQDCLKGEIGDSKAVNIFNNKEDFSDFISLSLSDETIKSIIETYSIKFELDDDDVGMELEAYAIASSVQAVNISEVIEEVCSNERRTD